MKNLIPLKAINDEGVISIKNGIKYNPNSTIPVERKPKWLRINLGHNQGAYKNIRNLIKEKRLNTVCEEAMCPNIGECWGNGTATFMLMGSVCTRACKFCSVNTGNPKKLLDKDEPNKVAESVLKMNLKYIVLTSVNRDDLDDGGAAHLAKTVSLIKNLSPTVSVEVLSPDFGGSVESLKRLLNSEVDVFAQNVETVRRLTREVRDPRAGYIQTLELLDKAKEIKPNLITKTSIMLGLGESYSEIYETMRNINSHRVDVLTIGQYMRPTKNHLPVSRWVSPKEFEDYKKVAKEIGFKKVFSGPLVRSSYRADLVVPLLKY